jgi:phosphoribosylanthranilate isomerase
MFIKFCGFTRAEDVDAAVSLSVSAVGFVFHPPSARYVPPGRAMSLARSARGASAATVGVFVDLDAETIRAVAGLVGLDYLQVYDTALAAELAGFRPVIMACRVKDPDDISRIHAPEGVSLLLLDSHNPAKYGGTGEPFPWEYLRDFPLMDKTIIAGGINEYNLASLLSTVTPFGIDISSGIESSPGVKSAGKMKRIITILNEVLTDETVAR